MLIVYHPITGIPLKPECVAIYPECKEIHFTDKWPLKDAISHHGPATGLTWFKAIFGGIPLQSPPFGVTSAEVVLNCPDIYTYIPYQSHGSYASPMRVCVWVFGTKIGGVLYLEFVELSCRKKHTRWSSEAAQQAARCVFFQAIFELLRW